MLKSLDESINVGFVSFRFQGTDGVSLETSKWAHVLEEMGHECYYFSGCSDRPEDRSIVVDEAHFLEPENRSYYNNFFSSTRRTRDQTRWIHARRIYFKDHIYRFIEKFDIDLLIPQNVLSFPLNIPLSLALVEVIAETALPTIAHHHDFTWERKPLFVNSI